MKTAARRAWAGGVVLAGALLLSGCNQQSPLAPHSGPSRKIADLWWGMLAAAGVVVAGAVVLILIAWTRRRREGLPVAGKDEGVSTRLVVAFGIVIPVAALVTLFAVADVGITRDILPRASSARVRIDVVGHQWFWEVRYPGTTAVTANEIHIPARTRVMVVGTTADVIHSFWVPELNRKVDLIPGRRNRVVLYADRPGRYRGQCAEFCGLQHANMALYVFADPPARFAGWLAAQQRASSAGLSAEQARGRQLFMSQPCGSCHTIAGTPAVGRVGPDLSHVAGRTTLAALTTPNRPDRLAEWIRDPQRFKPGNKMPGLALSDADLRALVAYLETLR